MKIKQKPFFEEKYIFKKYKKRERMKKKKIPP